MLNIPKRTKELLEKDTTYYAFVHSCISKLTPWLNDNKTVFFPEYTDHSFIHLNEVLLTSDSIISDESWSNLTPQDTAAMIVSVLLHDCAMHITEDGFYSLIEDKLPEVESRYTGIERKWSYVWLDFMAEAKRFDSKKLNSIFGDENPIKDLPANKIDLTTRDKLLIGEFIRRHHARIAHEIAFYGVPGVNGETIKLADGPNNNFLDLCGFIARSHNLGLREAVDKLEKNKKQVHLNTHVPFIMLVLRISDYIQIHTERAPENLLSLKMLVSPISVGEWKKHNSIVELNQAHEDPEAIYVDAEPVDAITYQELKKLFLGIQLELDKSWSVLGEVYGRHKNLNFGITIRRIRSSLDSLNEFIENKKPKYIPKVLSFKTADSEMMELLIAPLYGNKPEIGIRELVQNSIDACSELKDIQVKKGDISQREVDYDVCISLYTEEDNSKLVIEDHGIGMTLDIVENYFLNIGASFRNSDRWKKDHETNGHSNVYRTGRFGIGLLAAYLLGEEMQVETRHVNEPKNKAMLFKCKKGDENIVVSHIDFHVGTRITINISNEVRKKLLKKTREWDWFSLKSPKVIRKIIGEKASYNLDQARNVPASNSNLENTHWNRTISDGYDDIQWTFEDIDSKYRRRHLICNGILITDNLHVNEFEISGLLDFIATNTPSINVFDQDGRLPINLDRSALVSRDLLFMKEMSKDISDYLVKKLINFVGNICYSAIDVNLLSELSNISINGLRNGYLMGESSVFIINDEKLLPLDYGLISNEKIKEIYIDAVNLGKNQGAWTSETFLNSCSSYFFVDKITSSKKSRTNYIRTYLELDYYSNRFSILPIAGRRILIKKSDVFDIVTPGNVPKTFWNRLRSEWSNENWVLMAIGYVPELSMDLEKVTAELSVTNSFGFICCYFDWEQGDVYEENSFFSQSWLKENNQESFIKMPLMNNKQS